MIKNKKLYQLDEGLNTIPRVWRRKARGKQSPRILIKCGDCDKKVEICYPGGDDPLDDIFEINGVCATREQWQEIFREIRLTDNRV
jgi:hypothetical protein